jgi:hypothetical protein
VVIVSAYSNLDYKTTSSQIKLEYETSLKPPRQEVLSFGENMILNKKLPLG